MSKILKVLFVCEHNSARSQMAEAFLKALAPDKFEVKSAGIAPGALNPHAVKVMAEIGLDFSKNKTQSVDDLLAGGEMFDIIITVCDPAATSCPVFPGSKVLNWSFEDPSKVTGTENEKLEKVRVIRDEIRSKVLEWMREQESPRGNS